MLQSQCMHQSQCSTNSVHALSAVLSAMLQSQCKKKTFLREGENFIPHLS